MKAITVTLNPSFDTTLFLDGIHFDRANRVNSETCEAGGKGINVSRVLQSLGVKTEAFCIVGYEDSERFSELLGDCGHFHFAYNPGKTRENITMRAGDRCVKINRRGNDVADSTVNQLLEDILSAVQKDDIIVISGSSPKNFNGDRLLNFCLKLKNSGAKIVIDSEQLSANQLSVLSPFMIKPNEYEIKKILGEKESDEDAPAALVRRLYEKGTENVLLTLGEKGMTACLSGKIYRVRAARIEAKSTVGAGDSTVAGFVAAKLLGMADVEALKLASGCGTAAAASEGTGLAEKDEAEKYAALTEVEAL